MVQRLSFTLLSWSVTILSFLYPSAQGAEIETEDPADALCLKFRVVDDAGLKNLFEKLRGDDFDQREHAMRQLIRLGSGLLPLIDKHLDAKSPQSATLNGQLRQRILCGYDGYFPTDSTLRERLKQKAQFNLSLSPAQLMKRFSDALGFPVVFEPGVQLPDEWDAFVRDGPSEQPLEVLVGIFGQMGVRLVPRGALMLAATPETAEKVTQQRHTFDWSELQLSRDESVRVSESLRVFFPANASDITPSPETLTVRGTEDAIPRAARLLELLKPGSPDKQWPAPNAAALDGVLKRLAAPAKIALNAEDPVNVVEGLNKAGHAVFATSGEDRELRKAPPYPSDLRAAAPIRLALNEQPLAFGLQWIQRRTRFTTELQGDSLLAYDIDGEGRILLRVRLKEEDPLALPVLGVDAGFLYPKNARPNAAADAEVKKKVLEALAPHLELFPALDEKNVVVLRGRLLAQGSPATLRYLKTCLNTWRSSGRVPDAPAWRSNVDAKLNAELAWDGRRMTAAVVIPALRKMGKIDILIEDAADGTAANFSLTAQDAQLLPPGNHTLRALLDELARRAEAAWRVDAGVIVLRPKPAK